MDRPSPGNLPQRRRGIEFDSMPVREILNRCANRRMPFGWTINPYRGCEMGCVYCYARYTHEFLDMPDPLDFEHRILVKQQAAKILERSLARTALGREAIAIGTATDPYQPAERQFEVTRSLLEIFARVGELRLSITTKSALIVRDLDLLCTIAQRSRLSVNFSLITLDRTLQRMLEPRAPRPQLRLQAMRQLSTAGIACNLMMMPMIPGLTDSPSAIEQVMTAAKQAGARAVYWRALFLKPAAAAYFLPFIRRRLPESAPGLERMYAANSYAPAYERELELVFTRLCAKLGWARSTGSPTPKPAPVTQLSLRFPLASAQRG
ncbi:MAG TPA: radical SAM protein [Candidatus Binataceae bacterium]|nr:radical SAM protein [Candidatus Binataceae bacterium]